MGIKDLKITKTKSLGLNIKPNYCTCKNPKIVNGRYCVKCAKRITRGSSL